MLGMDAALWLQIIAGVALLGLIASVCFGIWRAAIWLRNRFRWAD